MLRRAALVRTDVSEELSAFTISVTSIGELGTTLTLEALNSSETSVITRPTRRNIPEDAILHISSMLLKYTKVQLSGVAIAMGEITVPHVSSPTFLKTREKYT
jgi:hypothetical protein